MRKRIGTSILYFILLFISQSTIANANGGLNASCSSATCDRGLECINFICVEANSGEDETQETLPSAGETNQNTTSEEGSDTTNGTLPSSTSGQNTLSNEQSGGSVPERLVQCGYDRDCTLCDIFILIRNIFNFVLFLLGGFGVLSIVIGGIYMILSSGNPQMYQQGVTIITNAVIGLVLAISSFLIFGFGLQALGFQEQNFAAVFTFQSGQFFEVRCDSASYFTDRGGWGTGWSGFGIEGGSSNVGQSGGGASQITCSDLSGDAQADINNASAQTGVPAELIAAIMQRECPAAFNDPQGCSGLNFAGVASGPMQFTDQTWNAFNCSGNINNRRDATICAGKKIISDMQNTCSACTSTDASAFENRSCVECIARRYCGACVNSACGQTNYCHGIWNNYEAFRNCN